MLGSSIMSLVLPRTSSKEYSVPPPLLLPARAGARGRPRASYARTAHHHRPPATHEDGRTRNLTRGGAGGGSGSAALPDDSEDSILLGSAVAALAAGCLVVRQRTI